MKFNEAICAVTAFTPIPDHPRSSADYWKYGRQLLNLDIPLMSKTDQVIGAMWLYNLLKWRDKEFTHSISDNPKKNSIGYHVVQAQKTDWLVDAARTNPDAKVFVWIDFGIYHIPGVTDEIIRDFLKRAESEQAIAIPGCWEPDFKYDDSHPCWRFCGGLMVVPRKYVIPLDIAWKYEYMRWLNHTNNVSWEVNCLARLERLEKNLPLWWYKADHDASMFTAYKGTSDAGKDSHSLRPH